jgi:hypothetical protein
MSSISSIVNFVALEDGSINLNDFAVLTQAMTPYDLVLYGLKAFAMSDYNASQY